MENFICHIHDTHKLESFQLDTIKVKIKKLLHLDSIEIGQPDGEFYSGYL